MIRSKTTQMHSAGTQMRQVSGLIITMVNLYHQFHQTHINQLSTMESMKNSYGTSGSIIMARHPLLIDTSVEVDSK